MSSDEALGWLVTRAEDESDPLTITKYRDLDTRDRPPSEPGHYWFRKVTSSEEEEWMVVDVVKMKGGRLFSIEHERYIEDVGEGKPWEPEWGGRIPRPPSEEGEEKMFGETG